MDAAAQKIANTISSKLMPPLANAKQIIENAESHPGVTVHEDLSITYTAPEGTTKETADANARTVAAAEAELKAEAAKWWAAENEVATQIRDAEATIGKNLNFGAALFDPHRAMPPAGPAGQVPGGTQAVFPPSLTQPQTAITPSGLGDLLGAGEPEPRSGPPKTWQDMLLPATGGKGDGGNPVRSLSDFRDQIAQGTVPAGQAPIPSKDVEAFKVMARQTLIREGVPPEQIEQRLNAVVARAQEGSGLMGNRVPQPQGRGPEPGFAEGFADRWFGTEQMVHNLLGVGGPGAPGVLESWAGLAQGAAETVVKPPIAGIVEGLVNSPNPAYYAGGVTADAAMTAPTLMFGGEGALLRGGLGEVEGTGLLPHHFPDHTPVGTGGHLPIGTGDHSPPVHHPGQPESDFLPGHSHIDSAPVPSGIALDMRPMDALTPEELGAMQSKVEGFNQSVADDGFQQVAPGPRDPAIRRMFLESLGLDRVPPGMHVDHIRDLQAGGLDSIENMMLLNGRVNMSFGKQLNIQMSQYEQGTIFAMVRLLEGNR